MLSPDAAWLSTLTVLYVEDDETTRIQLGRFLRRRVGRLLEAADGVEALECFRAERPHLVVTDIQMPRMDGLTLALEIRGLEPHVPILVTTAFEQIDYLRRAIDVGIDRYVTKPVGVDALEKALFVCARLLRAAAALEAQRLAALDAVGAHEREALGLLAGGMAHDFNNLVQVVLGNLSLAALDAPPGTELAECIESALAAAREAGDLGSRLVTLSESSLGEVRPRALEPTLRMALAASPLDVRLDLEPGLPVVPHDEVLLSRAFEALVRNAAEATRGVGTFVVTGRSRRLEAEERAGLAPGDYVELTFRDTGPGIPPEILHRVFDPYFSTKPRGGTRGMGLGLALCRAIVNRHRGRIEVASTPGAGAGFTVLLPAFEPEPGP